MQGQKPLVFYTDVYYGQLMSVASFCVGIKGRRRWRHLEKLLYCVVSRGELQSYNCPLQIFNLS